MKINVGVFFGGSSVEHEISVISALQAIHSMDGEKYHIVPVYISKDSNFYTGDALLDIERYTDMDKLLGSCSKVAIARNGEDVCGYRNPPKAFGNNLLFKLDVAFPIVHGTNCEDGTVQGFLEMLRIPYVGSDILSSAVGMDKITTKKVLKEHNIPVLNYISFYSRQWHENSEELIRKMEGEIGYPLIIKPANLGSSVGIKKAANRGELEQAIDLAQSFSNQLIVEKAITKLKEVNCSVLGDHETASPSACEEPIGSDEILSYNDKYMSGGSGKGGSAKGSSAKGGSSKGMSSLKRKLPADISPEMEAYIKDLAVKTFKAIGCGGVVRIDFLVDTENDNAVYVNELNTIPGSLAFYLWEPVGKKYGELLDEMISLAFKRNRERQQLMFTYNTNIFAMKGTKGSKS